MFAIEVPAEGENPMNSANDLIAPLPDDARFEAYYFGFEPTGIGIVDAILSAVAVAGKGSHHTQSWCVESDSYVDRAGLVDGESAADLIQKNADRSATAIRSLLAELDARDALIAEAQEIFLRLFPARGNDTQPQTHTTDASSAT